MSRRPRDFLRRAKGRIAPCTFMGESAGILEVHRAIEEVAGLHVTVLTHGERWTEKDLGAKAIRETGDRRDKGCFPVNCREFGEGLLDLAESQGGGR